MFTKCWHRCKDYYEILGVTKESTDSEIKKAYKKLALQLHPDKNKAPGAAEAFKAVGNAVATLTDNGKYFLELFFVCWQQSILLFIH